MGPKALQKQITLIEVAKYLESISCNSITRLVPMFVALVHPRDAVRQLWKRRI